MEHSIQEGILAPSPKQVLENLQERIEQLEKMLKEPPEPEVNPETGFTEAEQRVSDHLVGAFNEFCRLERTHPNETEEFVSALHRLQDLLAVRIVRRQFPKGWPTYPKRKEE